MQTYRPVHPSWLAAGAAACLLVAGCAQGSDGDTPEASTAAITIADFAFDGPPEVTAGTVVTVTNADAVGHTWTAVDESFDSGFLDPGDEFSHTLDTPGTYAFFCVIHPSMTGAIVVTG